MMIVGVSISDEPRDRGMQDGGLRSARATHEQHDAMKTGLHTRATRTTLTTAPLPHALHNKRKLCAQTDRRRSPQRPGRRPAKTLKSHHAPALRSAIILNAEADLRAASTHD